MEKQTPRAWARERGQKGRNTTSKTQISSLGLALPALLSCSVTASPPCREETIASPPASVPSVTRVQESQYLPSGKGREISSDLGRE